MNKRPNETKNGQKVDTDYSGRPLKTITREDIINADYSNVQLFDTIAILPDGTHTVEINGAFYPIDEEGKPDFSKAVYSR